MNMEHKALAFFLNSNELQGIFPLWPELMHLALCLRDDGSCQILVYREEEGRRFLPRLQRVLGLRISEICFVPEIKGLSSRKLLYSEEKNLLALVSNSPELLEEALDYTENFTFAMEEGLDPIRFLENKIDSRKRIRPPADTEPEIVQHHFTRKEAPPARDLDKPDVAASLPEPLAAEPAVVLPSFMRSRTSARPGPGFRSIARVKKTAQLPANGYIEAASGEWLTLRLPGCSKGQMTIEHPGRIFVSDDWRVLAVHSSMFGEEAAALPERILISTAAMADWVREKIIQGSGEVKTSLVDGFLYVHLQSSLHVDPDNTTIIAHKWAAFWMKTPRGLWMVAGIAAICLLFLTGFQFGSTPQRVSTQEIGVIDWSEYRNQPADAATVSEVRFGLRGENATEG